jgi:putative transposase
MIHVLPSQEGGVEMLTEIMLRKKAVNLDLQGTKKTEIARRLNKSRLWVHRWVSRYDARFPEESLKNRSCAPKEIKETYPKKIKDLVLRSRKEREAGMRPAYKYALIGAEVIHYELRELGISPLPPVRTIHSWLKQAGLIKERKRKTRKPSNPTYPILSCKTVNARHELDLKGPFYLMGSSQKYYLAVLRDVYGKKVALKALTEKEMEPLIDFLVESWQNTGRPKCLQMDNGLEFRGSNRYPRSLGKLMRVCLDLGVKPVFIPTREPWRNGVIENLNGLIQRLFLKAQTFETEKCLRREAKKLETSINTTHRLPALDGKTPQEFSAGAHSRSMPSGYDWRTRNLRLLKGKVSFIRLVRKSGKITLTAKDKFFIGKKYKWQYILATVDVHQKQLNIYLNNKLIKSFAYV